MTRALTTRTLLALATAVLVSGCGSAPKKFGEGFGSGWREGSVNVGWRASVGELDGSFGMQLVGDQLCVGNSSGAILFLDAGTGVIASGTQVGMDLIAGQACSVDRYAGLGSDFRVRGFDTGDGASRWQVVMTGNLLAAPTLAGDTVLLFQTNGLVRAHSLSSGDELWRLELATSSFRLAGAFEPLVVGQLVYFGMPDGTLYAINHLDGVVAWRQRLFELRWPDDPTANISNVGGAAVDGDFLCASAFNGNVSCIDRRQGRLLWSQDASSAGSIATGNDTVYFIDPFGALVALRITDGEPLWQVPEASADRAAKVLVTADGVFVDNAFGGLSLHDPATGELLGGLALAGKVQAAVAHEGDLIVLTTTGEVLRLRADA